MSKNLRDVQKFIKRQRKKLPWSIVMNMYQQEIKSNNSEIEGPNANCLYAIKQVKDNKKLWSLINNLLREGKKLSNIAEIISIKTYSWTVARLFCEILGKPFPFN